MSYRKLSFRARPQGGYPTFIWHSGGLKEPGISESGARDPKIREFGPLAGDVDARGRRFHISTGP